MMRYGLSPYEEQLAYAENNGIFIYQDQAMNKFNAAAFCCGGERAIYIYEAAFPTEDERRWAFAHELEHCLSGHFYTLRTPRHQRARTERFVHDRTIQRVVPFDKYCETLLSGILTEYEQSEQWSIPQRYVRDVHKTYRRLYAGDVNALYRRIEIEEI